MRKKYIVTVESKVGTCDNDLFEKMAKKGDITAIKLTEIIGKIVLNSVVVKVRKLVEDINIIKNTNTLIEIARLNL